MKQKFNRIERIAGVFVMLAIGGSFATGLSILVKKGIFEPKIALYTRLDSSSSIRPGTAVRMAGIRIGSVQSVDLEEGGKVRVSFAIWKKYIDRVKSDSRVQLGRPSIIGEKVMDVVAGSQGANVIEAGGFVPIHESPDALDILTGQKLATLLVNVDAIATEVISILQQMSHEKNLQKLLSNLRLTTDDLRKSVPQVMNHSPQLGEDLSSLISNFAVITKEVAKLAPQLNDQNGKATRETTKMVELLNETLILVKGMKKSFLFRGGVSDAIEEDQEKEKAKQRVPASESVQTEMTDTHRQSPGDIRDRKL